MRALALAHAQAPTPAPIFGPCSTPPSALDPFIGARPRPSAAITSRPPLAWILAHHRTTAVFRPSKNLHRFLPSHWHSGGAPFFRAESSLHFTLRRLDRPTLAALTASRMRRPSRPCHRRPRVWPGTYTTWALTCPLAPTIPVRTPPLAAPSHPGAAVAPPQAFASRPLPRQARKSTGRPHNCGAALPCSPALCPSTPLLLDTLAPDHTTLASQATRPRVRQLR